MDRPGDCDLWRLGAYSGRLWGNLIWRDQNPGHGPPAALPRGLSRSVQFNSLALDDSGPFVGGQ